MYFLVTWIVTSLLSIGLEVKNEFRLFKDAADIGYKIDLGKISNVSEKANINRNKTKLLFFIPIVNIACVINNILLYNENREIFLDELSVLDALDRMDKNELEYYKKNPTSLNAYIISLKKLDIKQKYNNNGVLNFDDECCINFKFNDEKGIEFIDGKDKMEDLNNEQQEKINHFQEMFSKVVQEYGGIDNFLEHCISESEKGNILKYNITEEGKVEEDKVEDIKQKKKSRFKN